MRLPTPTWPKRLPTRIAVVVAVLLVAAGATFLVIDRMRALPDNAAFRIGDHVVTEAALQDRIDVIEALYGIRQPAGGKRADAFRRASAKAVAVSYVLDSAARDRGIVIADRAARDSLTKMIERQMGPQGRAKFVELLGQIGASEHDVLAEIKRQQRTARLVKEATKDVAPVSEADVRRAFHERRDQMRTSEKRRIRNIVVASKKEANRALQQVQSGTDFTKLVQRNSLDQSTRATGGDLGFVVHDQLEQHYADAAFATAPGKFFGPIKTRFGWNIGQILEVRKPTPLSYEDVKKDLRATLESERVMKAWRDWLGAELKKADVEYADQYRPANPDAPPKWPTQAGFPRTGR